MRRFYYTAVNTKGVELSGMTEAESRDEAIESIKKRDLFPTYVNGLDDGPMRPIPPSPRVVIEGGPGGLFDKTFIFIMLGLIVAFFLWSTITVTSKWQDKKIENIVKQMVKNECLVDKYRGK